MCRCRPRYRHPEKDPCAICVRYLACGYESGGEPWDARSQDDRCDCGETQHAVHLRRCILVEDRKGRSLEQCQEDMEWCEAVVDFLV